MKKFLKIAIIVVLILAVAIVGYTVFKSFSKNSLIDKIVEANTKFINGNQDFHISIKSTGDFSDIVSEDDPDHEQIIAHTEDIYKQGNTLTSVDENNNSTVINSDELLKFTQVLKRNDVKKDIKTDDNYYIVSVDNTKYYFNKDNYLIVKEEVYGINSQVTMESTYSYLEN